jgi:hypothetical protein
MYGIFLTGLKIFSTKLGWPKYSFTAIARLVITVGGLPLSVWYKGTGT